MNKAEFSEVNTHRVTATVSTVKLLVVTHDFESLTSYNGLQMKLLSVERVQILISVIKLCLVANLNPVISCLSLTKQIGVRIMKTCNNCEGS